MKRTTIKQTVGLTILTVGLAVLLFWSRFSEAFGPMEQDELQCLICHRERVEKWVCGSKVRDDIVANEYSEWIDSFTPSTHEHVWSGTTSYNRSYWFGPTSVGCGGIATIPRIFEQRNSLGELEAQQLATRFHQLVRRQTPQIDFNELGRFTNAVVENPASLLEADDSN